MKRTFKFCALLFCAMLWFNPVGAQQIKKNVAEQQAGMAMDKAPLAKDIVTMDRQAMTKAEMLPLLKQSDVKSARELNLSDEQKKEMVKAAMKQMAPKSGDDLVSPFIGSAGRRTVLFDITGNNVSKPEIVADWIETNVGIAYPGWGAWCGDHFEGWYLVYQDSTEKLYNFSYLAYDPQADKLIKQITTVPTEVRSASMAVYDIEEEKIYAIKNVWNATYSGITDVVVYESAPLTGEFTEAGHINVTSPLVASAISKEGVVYIITADSKLYSVDKENNWTATLVGETGIPTDTYNQSASIDPRTNTLYWAYVQINPETEKVNEIGVATVNTSTAEVTKIEPMYYQIACMASIYDPDNNPQPVDPFGLAYDATDKKVVATFVAPEKTINGLPIAELDSIILYSVVNDRLGEKVGAVKEPVPGQKYTMEIELTDEEGVLTYAAQVKDKEGVLSDFAIAEVMLLNVELPYVNGFEANETAKMANVTVYDPTEAGGVERTNAAAHTGDYSYLLTSNFIADYRMLNIEALPVQKGGEYSISFWAKSSSDNNQMIFYWLNDNLGSLFVVGAEWKKYECSYAADIKGQLKFSLSGGTTLSTVYIDDVEIKEVASPNVPGLLTINSVSATENNALSAVMNITLPSLAVSEEPLASITGVVVQYADDAAFTEYKVDTIKTGLTVGATDNFTVQIEKAGQYYFRAYAYNEFGPCPQYSTYASRSPWIGPKNMPVSMATAIVNEDGNVKVEWKEPAVANEISWTANDTMARRLTIDGETAFKYAQSFTAADLASYGMATPKALQIGFVPGSETADYTLVLAYEGTEEIYRKEIDKADLKENEWYYTTIDKAITIDVTKELWVIVEVAENENQGYACATTGTTVAEGKSNKMWYNGNWTTISKLFTNGAGSVLVSLRAEDPATTMAADNGYKIYRGKIDAAFEDYDSLDMVTTKNFIDAEWKNLEFGRYNYAVVAVWEEADATPVMTNVLNKDMEMTMTFAITSNAGSAEGAEVAMIGAAERKLLTAVADKDGKVVFEKVWRDKYTFEVVLPFHKYFLVEDFDLTKDTLVRVALEEIIVNPELIATVEGKNVVINYGVNMYNWIDDVESYTDFAIENIGDYTLSEPVAKIVLNGYTWNNYDKPQSWIVLNSATSTPAFLPAHSGNKMFVAWRNADGKQNNDYLIRPVGKGGGLLQFYRRGTNASNPESFDVVYSSTTADLSAFETVKAYRNVNNAWTNVSVDIPEDAKYVGIRYNATNQFGLFIDDLSYLIDEPANPTAYELYLDGEKVKDAKVDELTYTFEDLAIGEHKVGVKAIYASGASELVEKTVKVSAEAMPISLNVVTEERTAVLTWDMPEGFAPKSYKVFLGEELKAENLTEKTYTFNDLANGNYTAAVVAVYETGESEKATIEFAINSNVDVEEFGMAVRSKVYPNPSNGMFYLQAADKGLVEVYAMNGQLVKRVEIPAQGTYSINLQNRTRGMYLLKFATSENTSLFKLVIR